MAEEKKEEKPAEQAPQQQPAAAAPAPAAAPAAEKPANCPVCNKLIKKIRWYYRNGKYFCSKRCWQTTLKKEEKPAEGQPAQ